MTRIVVLTTIALAASVFLGGCSGEKVEPEPKVSQEQGAQAASNWTEEQKAAFKKAHDNARAGGK